jgi:hypothetical protein
MFRKLGMDGAQDQKDILATDKKSDRHRCGILASKTFYLYAASEVDEEADDRAGSG